MIDLFTRPPICLQVLESLQLPDRAPRHIVDTVVAAVARRLPGVRETEIEVALRGLQALGLVVLPYLDAPVSPRGMAHTRSWIPEAEWPELGRNPTDVGMHERLCRRGPDQHVSHDPMQATMSERESTVGTSPLGSRNDRKNHRSV